MIVKDVLICIVDAPRRFKYQGGLNRCQGGLMGIEMAFKNISEYFSD